MTQVSADFETGVNGNNLSTGDTGSATAFNTVALGGSPAATAKYDTAHVASGTLAVKFTADSGQPGRATIKWTAIGTVTDHYGRAYIYLTAHPVGQTPIIQIGQGATRGARIDITSAGKLAGFDNPGAAAFTTTTTSLAVNQWVRIEWHVVHSATVGQVEVKLFNTATSGTATETSTGTANKNTLANADNIEIGMGAGSTNAPAAYAMWMDDIVAGAVAYPGPVAAPANSVAPAVTGTQTVGSVLSCSTGTWTGSPTPTYTYQWQRGGVNIGSATANTYTLVNADDATTVRCVVTATNVAGAVAANSNGVAITEPVPTISVAPAITGTTALGDVLTCSTGTWTNMGGTIATYAYQWKRGGVNISGQTASTHTIVSADQGTTLTCSVTATNTGGASSASTSNGVAIDAAAVASTGLANPGLIGYLATHQRRGRG